LLNKWRFFILFQGLKWPIPALPKSAIRRLIPCPLRADFRQPSRREMAGRREPAIAFSSEVGGSREENASK
jgi:hypothetical protein